MERMFLNFPTAQIFYMISIDALAVEFDGKTLFSDISFVINEKDRIALMGKNGAGKSTLLKILAGVRKPTRGSISAPKDCVVAYLPQHLMTEDGRTVFEEASQAFSHLHEMEEEINRMNQELTERTDYESDSYMQLIEKVAAMSEKFYAIDLTHFEEDVEKTLLGLGFERSDFNRPTSEFSGGWRMRADQPPRHRVNPMAGGLPYQQRQSSSGYQPRPPLRRQYHDTHHRGDNGPYLRL